ncbi:T9SS type A sorting domain-containing protein [Bacteroidota bacterium]
MKTVLFTFLLVLLSFTGALSQLTSPESIIRNEYTKTYIISDAGAGKLLSMDKSGSVSDFTTGLNQPKGLVMGNFSLWVTDVTEIVEIDPLSGEIIETYPIAGSRFLNDIATDNFGYLFISDMQNNRIYRFDELSGTAESFSNGMLPSPNGIYYDFLGGLIVVSYADPAGIYTVDAEEGNVEELMQTQLGQLDGIAYDTKRNRYYVSSWKTNSVYILDPAFMDPPELLQSGIDGPADLFYDELTDTLIVPAMNSGAIVFIGFGTTDIENKAKEDAEINIYPNPAADRIYINTEFNGRVEVDIFDMLGALKLNKNLTSGELCNGIEISSLTSGVYILRLKSRGITKAYRFVKE